jgi:hypothetical protein
MISEKTSSDLFNKVRSKFSNIQLGDDLGNVTADPRSAVFFDFEFREDAENFGRVSVSIADGETMKVFYNMGLVEKLQDQDKTAWYSFLKELKDFAVEHQIGFDVRDISKSNLSQQDYKNLADTNKTVNTAGMSEELNRITKLAGVAKAPVAEGLTGTSKSSYESLDKTKLIVRHSKPVESNMPGARTRHINSLYIENEQGERFKYPIVHLAGARAMQRHIANGGVPHDQFGEHIVKMSEQIAQLNSFSRYTANKDQLNDSAGDIIEKAKMKLETMRKYVKGLSKQKNYESIKETFQPTTIAEIDEETKNNLKDKFTLKHFDEKIDQVLPLISSIMSEYDDADAEADANDKDAQNSPIVDQGSIIQGFLSDPNKKLILRLDDAMDKFNNTITRFTGPNAGNARLTTILSDIGSRMLSNGDNEDHIANFASSMSDQIGNEDAPFWKPTVDYVKNKKIAIQLAKRYLDDYNKLSRDPEYKNEVRKDPQDFKKFKNIKGKEYGDKSKEYAKQESPEAQFESWATNIVEGTDQPMIIDGKEVDESTIEYDMQDYGDLIAPISDAKFIDGTDLTPEQQEELESSTWYANWVMTDYNERQVESAEQPVENVSIDDEYRFRDWLKKTHNKQVHELKPQEYEIISKQYRDEKNKTEEQPVEEDASDDALAQELAKYFHGIADGYPKDQHGDQEHEEMTSIADAFKTDGLQAGMNDINTSRFEFSSNPFDQDGSGDMDDDMMMLLKKHGVSAKMKGALAYLVKGSKAITNPEEETATEGNDFAQAVNKAKAAGMKPGDKFTVGDKEYTLKDAIEEAGLQLETFFNEDDDDYEGSSDDYEGSFEYEFTGDDGEMAWGKIHYKAVNGQVEPNSLQGESEYEGNAKVDDEYATYVIQPGGDEHDEALLAAQEDYDAIAMKMQSKFEQPESEDNNELDRIKELSNIGNEDNAQEIPKGYHKMPDGTVMKDSEHKIKEAKPDFLDLDKDGNKTEPMKKAVADKELSEILNLAGI